MGKSRKTEEINASSMADIAFLLLIFFLVTTTIDVDKGILHKLPVWEEDPPPPPDVETYKRNLFEVLINSRDLLLVNGKPEQVGNLRSRAKEFINNKGRNPKLSDSPNKAIVSLQNDRGTSYGIYLEVQNELKAAYRELRDAYSERTYNMNYTEVKDAYSKAKKDENTAAIERYKAMSIDISKEYPMRLSEAEPKDLGN